MITSIRIQNYRSFVDTEVKLRPFSLVVGANGSGKSNLLRLIALTAKVPSNPKMNFARTEWQRHVNHHEFAGGFEIEFSDGTISSLKPASSSGFYVEPALPWTGGELPIFNINPTVVSAVETAVPKARVKNDGSGTAQVLEALKNGTREDLFDKIEECFRRYVPEVAKLSVPTVQDGKKQIQVSEIGLKAPLPATELSEGTRLILAILTIVHQENPPSVVLLEDIDRGMHPRIFEYVAPLMKEIAKQHDINILATTHNPYLVDCFQDDPEAVIIVEKKDGASTLSTLASRLEDIDYDKVNPDEMPLGTLWFSGLVGGVPSKITRRPKA